MRRGGGLLWVLDRTTRENCLLPPSFAPKRNSCLLHAYVISGSCSHVTLISSVPPFFAEELILIHQSAGWLRNVGPGSRRYPYWSVLHLGKWTYSWMMLPDCCQKQLVGTLAATFFKVQLRTHIPKEPPIYPCTPVMIIRLKPGAILSINVACMASTRVHFFGTVAVTLQNGVLYGDGDGTLHWKSWGCPARLTCLQGLLRQWIARQNLFGFNV